MGLFDSNEDIKARVQADMAYSRSKDNSDSIYDLELRLEALEKYLKLEWSESNQKYYKFEAKE